MWTLEDRRCTGSLLLSSLLQLHLCSLFPLYSATLERGREDGESCIRESRWGWGCLGCWGRQERIAEADAFFFWPSRILNDRAAGRRWGSALQNATCALDSSALIWEDRRAAAETRRAAGDSCYSLFSHFRSRTCSKGNYWRRYDSALLWGGMQQMYGMDLDLFYFATLRNCLPLQTHWQAATGRTHAWCRSFVFPHSVRALCVPTGIIKMV